ncbi:hypothetical protein C8R42DRAFT_688588 [Lentinula raphanica]|nr:hypothetical protein C8R42DRAFT_688588 [Lentinula raphanica]
MIDPLLSFAFFLLLLLRRILATYNKTFPKLSALAAFEPAPRQTDRQTDRPTSFTSNATIAQQPTVQPAALGRIVSHQPAKESSSKYRGSR